MKIWIDISNAPHALFFKEIIKELKKKHKVLVTARDYGPIFDVLKMNGIKFKPIGTHGGKELEQKLMKSAERMLELTRLISKEKPDVCAYKYSIEAARVSFGLGIPSVAIADNEYGHAQNMLTLPFADSVIVPRAILTSDLQRFGVKDNKVIRFDGVCETANVAGFSPSDRIVKEMDLDPEIPIVIVRPEPYYASYYRKGTRFTEKLIRALNKNNERIQIVVIPRSEKEKALEKKFSNVRTVDSTIDSLNLCYHADLVISAGGTMNREAALLGVPTIACFPESFLAVDRFLVGKGIMEHCSANTLKGKKLKVEKKKGHRKVPVLEDPSQIVIKEIERLGRK